MQANAFAIPVDVPPPAPPLPGTSTVFDPSKTFGQYAGSQHGPNPAGFRLQVSAVGAKKRSEALIDSGGTQNFFYDNELFTNYESMQHEKVYGPTGQSIVIGFGEVAIPLRRGKEIKEFHVH